MMMMMMMALLMITPRWWPPRTLGSILAQGELQVGGTSLAMSREVPRNNWIRALIKFIQKRRFGEYLFRCETSFRDERSIASVDATWYGGGGHSEKGEEHWQIVVVVMVRNIYFAGQSDRKESAGKIGHAGVVRVRNMHRLWWVSGRHHWAGQWGNKRNTESCNTIHWHFGHFDTAVMLIDDNNLILHQKLWSIWYSVVT